MVQIAIMGYGCRFSVAEVMLKNKNIAHKAGQMIEISKIFDVRASGQSVGRQVYKNFEDIANNPDNIVVETIGGLTQPMSMRRCLLAGKSVVHRTKNWLPPKAMSFLL